MGNPVWITIIKIYILYWKTNNKIKFVKIYLLYFILFLKIVDNIILHINLSIQENKMLIEISKRGHGKNDYNLK